VRIARYARDGTPGYAVVEQDAGAPVLAAIDGHPFGPFRFTGERFAAGSVRLLAPVIPSKVVAVGKNYAAHAAEMGGPAPDDPVIFLKPSTAVVGPGDPVNYPPSAGRVDYEGELAVVIGRLARRVTAAEAARYILGYTCANDVTARDQQAADGQWTRAKGHDSFCPLGPWVETGLDPADVALRTLVDGAVRQDGRTRDLLHPVAEIVAYVSAVMTLLPGDVILTGTPEGVGPLQVGEEVTVEIEGIGALTNPVVAAEGARG
jgi:2-keto-4-pentenoate hydratase/2-oxohepta-3-ene-1,7-dioic acid hydratase in catechol pathway